MQSVYRKLGCPTTRILHYQIQGYNIISQGNICSEHGGLAIYVSTKLNFDVINMNINSQIWEGQFIEISNMETNKLIIIGNV